MEFSVVVPTRGRSRAKLLDRCLKQIGEQTLQPTELVVVDYEPVDDRIDLLDRMKRGIESSTKEFVFVMEDDDYYHPEYLRWMHNFVDQAKDDKTFLFGIGETYYYHFPSSRYSKLSHTHSSLFCTVIRKSNDLDFPGGLSTPFIDLYLWKKNVGKKIYFADKLYCIGIKGLSGNVFCGKGHMNNFAYRNVDKNRSWIKSKMSEETFDFYAKFLEEQQQQEQK